MKRLFILSTFYFLSFGIKAAVPPDTVTVGVYINSIHDIDFKDKQYTINLWLWLKYKNPDFDFSKYLEVPMAKTVDKSFYTVDTLDDGRIYMLMKLQCVMKDSWKIQNFPFDQQRLRFTIENSQYDQNDLVFAEDTTGRHYSEWTSSGWEVIDENFKISTEVKKYETNFGDPAITKPVSFFSVFKVEIGIARDSWWLFFKLFIGMYISFLLAFLCFFIHSDSIESRFGLSVGSLFAVIGNKYVVDSALPESTSFTMVDSLHGLTLCFIFGIVACSAYALYLVKTNNVAKARKIDFILRWSMLTIYVAFNFWFVYHANYDQPI